MTPRARHAFARPVAGHRGIATPRGIAVVGLLLVASALSGCSMKILGHGIGLPFVGPKAGTAGPPDRMAEAREQAALDPREPYWTYQMGQFYLAADSLPAAEAALKASLARERTYAPALSLLSKLYFDAGRHEEAVMMLEPVESRPDLFPEDVRQALLAGMALHLDALGRPDLAGAVMARLPRPDLKRAGSAAVYVRLRGDHPDSADGLAAAALGEAPKSAVNLNNYGITRLRAADPASARRAFMSAIERDPDLPGPYYNLAILEKFYLFDDAAASRWFKAYWKRSQADPDSLLGAFAGGVGKGMAEKGN